MVLQSVLVYSIRGAKFRVLLQKHFTKLHKDHQDSLTSAVMERIRAGSPVLEGQLVPTQEISNLYLGDRPQTLIYQNLASMGVVLVLSSTGSDNRVAASLTLSAIVAQIVGLVKASSIEKVTSEPEDVYSILDSYIPNGQVLIANALVYKCM